jgi:membrane fusion protein (multidrug efflux system)
MKLKPSVILIILISVIVVYSVANRIWLEEWRAKRKAEKQAQAGPAQSQSGRGGGGAVLVDYMIVQPENFNEVVITNGTLVSNEQVDLRSEASGKVTAINFSEGSYVKAGTLLVKINDKDLQAQRECAIHRQKLAEDKERRQHVLLQKDAISREEYEIALTELNSLKAETELIKAQIERTEIRAPFDGTVGLRSVSLGEYISPQVTVARLVNNNPIKLDFSISEKYFDVVRTNTPVQFKIDGSDKTYNAVVYAIDPKIDLSTRTILMRALAPNPDGKLFAGAFARVQLPMTSLNNARLVPAEALLSEASGHKAFVYKDGKAEQRDLEIGTRTDKKTQVVKGLAIGDTLIVSGILQIRPNGNVKLNAQIE